MKNGCVDGRWYQDAVFYELRVRSFADGNGDGVGDFKGLTSRLGYLKGLGVDCLWLLPIHPSPLKDDGYDVADYYAVHPDYGTLADFKAFLREAHRLGLRVILDLVLNHTSDRCAWFQDSRRPGSPKREWYVWSPAKTRYAGVPVIFEDFEDSNWTWDRAAGAYYWHRFFRSQPDLNFENPEVREEMLKVAEFWLKLGVDGFRLDAVPYLFEKEGTRCQHLPRTHAYLRSLRRLVEERYPGRLLLAEAGGRPKEIFQYFGRAPGDECHMAFHFPLAAELLLALADGRGARVRRAFRSLPQPPKECAWGLFLRNHDGVNLSFLGPAERKRAVKAYAPKPGMLLHDEPRRRLAPMLGNDGRKLRLLHALLLSLPGSPVLYYGDEIGMGEDLSLPDRFGLRTPMDWAQTARA
ncbi:MAG: alpha-amylase family glycosyl hydrolase, partial [Elusimicrobiota bacterium]